MLSDERDFLLVMAKPKLPDFWAEAPDMWFARAEAEFNLRSITLDTTKYGYLVAHLPENVALRVRDAINSPHPDTPYVALKERLLKVFTLTRAQRAQRLLAFPQTVDERPSVVLDRMLALLPSDVDSINPGFLFEELFLRALDSETRALLASSKHESIRELAETADAFWSRRSAPAPVHAVSAFPTDSTPVQRSPGQGCDQYCMAVRAAARSSTATSAAAPRGSSTAGDGRCWYHARWGSRATRCRSPCSWRPAGNARGGKN